ncbi:hypothetical protein SAMN05192574_102454 [Mucilaginibacter gossypiicola]|uniref:Uncharacterized protein n=1 Tax=Mucilaginibacter gossypiicola TaxID=551995 RepID=A0A1H8DU54_9SPHI|nr:hypothetical protein [Mucilaginibacter gossypiicola]SEN10077.1 hypothetical protein SAMN05192574_102454 [Mucilaginibacter gossypiicola]
MEKYQSNAAVMEAKDKAVKTEEEKEWENPVEPTKTSDPRDEEQVLRQYKEAKRRHDNLSENEDDKKKD